MSLLLFTVSQIERIRLFYTAGWPDPFIYMGYAQNYAGLLEKWGPTYFASRISNIIPIYFREKIALDLQIYRYLILLCLATGVFILLHNRKGAVRVLIPVIAVNNVWVLRHISDDYVVGLTSVYVLFSFILALRSVAGSKYGELQLICAGVFIGLAINANLSIVLLLGPWFLSLALLRRRQIYLVKSIILVGLGCVASFVILGLFMYLRLGTLGLMSLKSQIDMIFVLRGPVGEQFSIPLVFFAPMIFMFCIVALGGWNLRGVETSQIDSKIDKQRQTIKNRSELEIVSICFALSILFGLIYHQYSPANWMSATYYLAFYIPAFLVTFALSLEKIKNSIFLVIAIVIQMALIYGLASEKLGDFDSRISSVFRVLLFCILIFMTLVAFTGIRSLRETHIVLMIFAASMSPLVTDNSGKFINFAENVSWSEYRDFARSSSSSHQEDVWKIARLNNAFLRENVPRSEVLFTIYPKDPSWLVSIDSGQVYGYSCFECTDMKGYQTIREYPPFSKSQIETLATRNYIEVMSNSKLVNSEIVESILASDPKWRIFRTIDSFTTTKEFYGVLLKKFNG
jgi:hypothetical protein